MSGCSLSIFNDPDDLQSALREAGYKSILPTNGGPFHVRLIANRQSRFRLTAVAERQSRVALMALPPGLVRIWLPTDRGGPIVCGMRAGPGELIAHGTGANYHERLVGPCRWRDIVLTAANLADCGRAITGTEIVLPSQTRLWRPSAQALHSLSELHRAATRVPGFRTDAVA